jgi:hypothetical protein
MLQSQAFTTPEYTWSIREIKYDEKLCQRYHEGIDHDNDGNTGSWQQGEGRLRTPLIGRTASPGRAGDPPNCASPFRGRGELATRSRSFFFPFLFCC